LTRINQLTDVVGSFFRWLPVRCRLGLSLWEHPLQDGPDIEADPSHSLRANPVEWKETPQDGPDIEVAASYRIREHRVEWRQTFQDGPDIEADPSHGMRSQAVEWRNIDENELRSRLAQLENAIRACLQMAALAEHLGRDATTALAVERIPARNRSLVSPESNQQEAMHVPPLTEKQRQILSLLDGRALFGKELAKQLDCNIRSLLRDHINPLMDAGKIKNNKAVGGYYCPDSPPKWA
jgi:hypothetical protein